MCLVDYVKGDVFCYHNRMNIQYDSRKVQPGDIFFAMPGLTVDGRHFIQQALDRGASKIVYEADGMRQFLLPKADIPFVAVEHLTVKQGVIAAEFYGFPARKLNVVGVTGTNGKTSITYFIAHCLAETAILGTTGYGRLPHIKKLAHTTPMATDVQAILKELVDDKVKTVAMEVSSHALEQHRVGGVEFDIAVFTNLSHDHLDFHGDMSSYAMAKKKLFAWPTLKTAVVNCDDPVGAQIVEAFGSRYCVLSYSTEQVADIYVQSIVALEHGFDMTLHTPWGVRPLHVPLLGRFNIANCLAVVGVLGAMGMPLDEVVAKIAQLATPPGRMQLYRAPGKPTVIVDFAHTPDALEKALMALREHCSGRLYTVFGCGGDRDPSKRERMGSIAAKLSDYVLVTNDNPRRESPEHIAQMICRGISVDKLLGVELDRRAAIERVLVQASAQDLILIAGKGHEDYQIIGDEVLPFNDGDIVAEKLLAQERT